MSPECFELFIKKGLRISFRLNFDWDHTQNLSREGIFLSYPCLFLVNQETL